MSLLGSDSRFCRTFFGIFCATSLFLEGAAHAGTPNFGELRPFWTDACTNFPDGTEEQPTLWEGCCVLHDLKYWAGGTLDQKTDADGALYKCVEAAGGPIIAATMVAGVAIGGSPYFDTYYRWGYGWPQMRGFNALSADELQQVAALTPIDVWLVPITKVPVYE